MQVFHQLFFTGSSFLTFVNTMQDFFTGWGTYTKATILQSFTPASFPFPYAKLLKFHDITKLIVLNCVNRIKKIPAVEVSRDCGESIRKSESVCHKSKRNVSPTAETISSYRRWITLLQISSSELYLRTIIVHSSASLRRKA